MLRNSLIIREEEDIELMFKYAAKAGFKEIMLSFGSSDIFKRDNYREDIEKIKRLMEEYGISCKQTHLPCYHLLVSSEIEDEETETSIKRAIEVSAELGAEWGAFHPRTAVNDGYNQKVSFEHNKEILKRYLEVAEKSGVGIAVENMPLYHYTNPHWRFFGGGWEELTELCDSFKSDKIGICWDFGHSHTALLNGRTAIKNIGDRLKMTHISDNYRNGDHHQLPALGSLEWGCVDWKEQISALKEIGYNGSMTLELIYPPLPMRESFVKLCYDCLEYLKEL